MYRRNLTMVDALFGKDSHKKDLTEGAEVFDGEIFRTMLRIGLSTGFQQSLVSLGFIVLTQMFITLCALWFIRIPASAHLSSRIGTPGIWWGIPAGWFVGFTISRPYCLRQQSKNMKMIIFSRALLLFDWHRQACNEQF